MTAASLLKLYLLQNYSLKDRIYVEPKAKPVVQEEIKPKEKEFSLNKKKGEKQVSDSAVERLKNFYATKVFLVTSEEEYTQNTLFFDRLKEAIHNKLHRCRLVNLDNPEELKKLEDAVANGSCVSVVGTKTSLRLYPKLKAQHKNIQGVHHLIHSPLIFIQITDDPNEKKKLWKEIKTYTHR